MTEDIRAVLDRICNIVAMYLETSADPNTSIVEYHDPDELERLLGLPDLETGSSLDTVLASAQEYLRYSVRTSHPQYFNQLWAGFSLPALVGNIVASAANTSMYTYEVAPAATVLERSLLDHIGRLVGFAEVEGQLVTGGSNGNLLAMQLARLDAFPDIKQQGASAGPPLSAFVSSDSHYSYETAASLMGLGTNSLVKIQTDDRGRMRPDALEQAIAQARGEGSHPFFIGATAGTTVRGAFDPLADLADIAMAHDLWLHVDGAWGGAVIFSEHHRGLMAGIERADSLVWDWHKMLGLPLMASAFLTRTKGLRRRAFSMGSATYIYRDEELSADLGPKSMQCGRAVDVLKLYFDWQYWGDEGYGKRVDKFLALAQYAADKIADHPRLELMAPVDFANVCFRILPSDPDTDLNEYNLALRNRLARSGRVLINYGYLGDTLVLRLVLANHLVERTDIDELFARLLGAAASSGETTTSATDAASATPDATDTVESSGLQPGPLDRSRIKVRSWLVLQEAHRRGYRTVSADYQRQTFRVERDGRGLTFQKLPGVSRFIRQYGYGACESKPAKKMCLQAAGLRVPKTFATYHRADEIVGGVPLSFPAIVKPVVGTLSDNVCLALDIDQAVRAGRLIEASGDDILIEEYVPGGNFRLLLVEGRVIGAVERRPASVVGNGKSTVAQLIAARNAEPDRGPAEADYFTNHLLCCDAESSAMLAHRGLTSESVPSDGDRVFLQDVVTATSGADYVDCTDRVHPRVRDICENFAHRLDLLVVGVDYIAEDIDDPEGAFNEFNLRPYIDLNENNNEGTRRPVSAAIWDYIERHGDELLTADGDPF